MATLESYQCKGCGSPLDKESLKKCPYCGSSNVLKSDVNPLNMNQDMAQKYVEFFKQKTDSNPKDTNSLFAMGLLYLGLKNYELAQRNFKNAIDLSPLESDMYYYYALSLIHGKSIKSLDNQVINRIEEYLSTAISMQVKCKYLLFQMAIKQEYYVGNGFKYEGESPEELYEKSKEYSSTEVDELLSHAILRDQFTIDCINTSVGVSTQATCKKNKREYKYLSEEQRYDYYFYPNEPSKPGSKDNPYPPIPVIKAVWRLGLTLVFTFILLAIFVMAELGFKNHEESIIKPSVTETFQNRIKESPTKLSKKEKNSLFLKLKDDSIATAIKDSIFVSEYITLTPNVYGNTKSYLGIKRSPLSVVLIFLLFVPLVLWAIKYFKAFKSVYYQIKAMKEAYKHAIEGYNNKPTYEELNEFVINYLSEIVDYELCNNKKHEDDFQGKILFVNFYENSQEEYDYSCIRYMIVLLEESKVTYLNNIWRIYCDTPEKANFHSAFYKDIKSVKVSSEEMSFGDISVPFLSHSTFEYQNINPNNSLTYSTTRTSDVYEFKDALDKLINSYKNKSVVE